MKTLPSIYLKFKSFINYLNILTLFLCHQKETTIQKTTHFFFFLVNRKKKGGKKATVLNEVSDPKGCIRISLVLRILKHTTTRALAIEIGVLWCVRTPTLESIINQILKSFLFLLISRESNGYTFTYFYKVFLTSIKHSSMYYIKVVILRTHAHPLDRLTLWCVQHKALTCKWLKLALTSWARLKCYSLYKRKNT